MRISFWKSTMQSWSSIGVNAESWMQHLNEFVFNILQSHVWICWNPMIIFPSPGFTISALSFMYTIWEIALQWWEGRFTNKSRTQLTPWGGRFTKWIFPNCKMYMSRLQNVFVLTAKCICLDCKMYLSKFIQPEHNEHPGEASYWQIIAWWDENKNNTGRFN